MSSRIDLDGDDNLHDANLRRALDHAPDRDDQPAAHTRAAILKMAHNMAAAPVAAAANNASAVPWWRRMLGLGEPGARMPWNAAFATVLVAGFVAVLWHQEPIPDARPDGEARVSEAPAVVPAQAQAPVPQASDAPAPVAPAAPPAEAARDRVASSSASREERKIEAPRRAAPPPAPAVAARPAGPSAFPASPPAAEPVARARQQEESLSAAPGSNRTADSAVAAAAPPPPPAAAYAPAPAAAMPPPAAIAPAPAVPPAVVADQERRSAFAGGAAPEASGALRESALPRPARAAKSAAASAAITPPVAPVFAALDTWTDFTLTRAGLGVQHMRGDLEGLPALLSSVARSATVQGGSLSAPLEARLELHRGPTLTAVLEIAGDDVRWTPQPGGASYTGTPPAAVLTALRSLLTR